MADFRKWIPVLAVVAMLLGSAVTASAQPALTCSTNAGVPPLLRAEALSDLVGDLILNCTGGDPLKSFQANFQIFLNTNITSRLIDGSSSRTEALLMIDEPCPSVVPAGQSCTGATINVGVNTFRGSRVTDNAIVWLGVPFTPPGATGQRIIRITNVRANASQLLPPGSSTSLIPPQVVMYISISGSQSVAVNNPQQIVGFVQTGLSFDLRKCDNSDGAGTSQLNYLQCVSQNKDAATDTSKSVSNQFALRFRENFATAFRPRLGATQDASVPGVVYNTESGFVGTTQLGTETGFAHQGTRLVARFTNVPDGVKLYGSIANAGGSSTISAFLLSGTDAAGAGGSAASSTNTGTCSLSGLSYSMAPITVTSGTAMAVWEITAANPFAGETALFQLAVSYVSNTTANSPGLGVASISGNFAPFYTLPTGTTMSTSLPVPRFVDNPIARTAFRINACVTNLLFPYVTNSGTSWDTGIAIANTSLDIFGTATQAGACEINYFGTTTGGGATPKTKETSQTVKAGETLAMMLSTGGTHGLTGNAGFTGYIIAKCFFQYAHGFAFISDFGANKLAEGYLALVMDESVGTRTGSQSETLGN